ncbi:MAG: PHB depolymerase family esterase [Gemmatimonadales bacterium]
MPAYPNRRHFAGWLLAAGAASLLPFRLAPLRGAGARLTFRPKSAGRIKAEPGVHPLKLGADRDGVLYVPRGYQGEKPVPLVLALHGATQSSQMPVRRFTAAADELGIAFVAPDSRLQTWDAIALREFGADRDFIDRALAAACERVSVDPRRVGIAGFSDGATYALALGRANGDLFRGVAAFSPGFLIEVEEVGRPPIFISHGTSDSILPIEETSRRLVPALQRGGYKVDYREFDGDHMVPPEMAVAGLRVAGGVGA